MRMVTLAVVLFSIAACVGPHYYYVKKNGEKGVYHRIEPGQTLWRISRAYGMDAAALARVNRLDDTFEINAGAYLFIPGSARTIRVPSAAEPGEIIRPDQQETREDAPADVRFLWPLRGTVTSRFGMRKSRMHEGIDIAAPPGTDIKAAADGVVVSSGWGPGDYGKAVNITHRDGFTTLYGHNSYNLVSEGAAVTAGQVIARVGRTGNASGNHVHFEIRKNGTPVNPLFFLPQ
jgi:murein DD-endopeptidase MepM/ murein hydrolase activator NlpD